MTADLDRILFTGGGTGGHVSPNLAIAEELRRRHPAAAFLYVGIRGKAEDSMVRRAWQLDEEGGRVLSECAPALHETVEMEREALESAFFAFSDRCFRGLIRLPLAPFRWLAQLSGGTPAQRRAADLAAVAPGASLAGADLREADLSGQDLSRIDFSGARLSGADLRGANLEGADLTGARLDEADLRGAHLLHVRAEEASFVGADLRGAEFRASSLRNANLAEAVLTDVDLADTDLSGASLERTELLGTQLGRADFTGAMVEESLGLTTRDFEVLKARGGRVGSTREVPEEVAPGANLAGWDLRRARLVGRDLSGVDFTGARLEGADLSRANLSGARLGGARLERARLVGANLSGVFAERVRLDDAVLRDANLGELRATEGSLIGADLRGAHFEKTHFGLADLSAARLDGCDLADTDLSGALLERTDLTGADMSQVWISGAVADGALGLGVRKLNQLKERGARISRFSLRSLSPRRVLALLATLPLGVVGLSLVARRELMRLSFLGFRLGLVDPRALLAPIPGELVFVHGRGYPPSPSPLRLLHFAASLGVGVLESIFHLLRFRPTLVVGTGGYASAPVLFAAYGLRRLGLFRGQIFIHEQNAVLGRLNKVAVQFANRVGLAFPDTPVPAEKRVFLGYPVRTTVAGGPASEERRQEARKRLELPPDARVLLAFGGSQGARTINRLVVDTLPDLLSDPRVYVIHGMGKQLAGNQYNGADDVAQRLVGAQGLPQNWEERYRRHEFIHDMGSVYAAADVVLCRGGAGSVKEACANGMPAIVIPKANLPGDHQAANARALERRGAVRVVYERVDLQQGNATEYVDPPAFLSVLRPLLTDPMARRSMSSAAFGQHEPDTLRWAGDVLEHLCGLREAPSIPEPQSLAPDGILGLSSNALDQKLRAAREQATSLTSEERALVRYKIDGYLASSSYVSRARGCRMVGNGGFTERLDVLMSFAGDRRESGAYQELPIVRRDAFRGLQHLGVTSPQVLDVLERGLSDPYFEARSKAAQAIGGAGTWRGHGSAHDSADGLAASAQSHRDFAPLIDGLITLSSDSFFEARANAIRSLGWILDDFERGREAFEGRRFDMRWQVRTAMIEAITRLAQRGVLSFDKARRQAAATLATSDGFRTHYTFKEAYNRLMAVGQSVSAAPSLPPLEPLPPWTGEVTEEVTEETTSHVERRRDSLLSALLLVLRPLLNEGGKSELEHTHSVDAFMDHLVGEVTESGAGGVGADPVTILSMDSATVDARLLAARRKARDLSREERALYLYKIDGFLASDNYVSRARGCRMVGNGGFTERLEVLICFGGDRNKGGDLAEAPIVRRDAFRGLQHLRSLHPRVIEVIGRGLEDPYFEARSTAACAIGGSGVQGEETPLAALPGGGEAFAPLIADLLQLTCDDFFGARAHAIRALGWVLEDFEVARDLFRERRFDSRWQVRSAMIDTLVKLAERGVIDSHTAHAEGSAILRTSDGFRTSYTFKEAYNHLLEFNPDRME